MDHEGSRMKHTSTNNLSMHQHHWSPCSKPCSNMFATESDLVSCPYIKQ